MSARTDAARLRVALAFPFYSVAVWRMRVRERTDLPFPMASDERWNLYVNPEATATWTNDQMDAGIRHELEHVLREHTARGKVLGDDPMRWNIAADCEINCDPWMTGRLIDAAMFPRRIAAPDGLTMEEYWDFVPEQRSKQNGAAGGGQSVQDGAGDGSKCQSATGLPQDWHEQGSGDVGPSEGELLRDAVARDVMSTPPGRSPGQTRAWAEARLAPRRTPWPVILARTVTDELASRDADPTDWTYTRHARRTISPDGSGRVLRAPAEQHEAPKVAIVLDTSGSMTSGDRLPNALAEVRRVLTHLGTAADLYQADTEVQHRQRNTRSVASYTETFGHGGTSMEAVLPFVAQESRCTLLIVVTDGETGYPSRMPCPVVVVLVAGDVRRSHPTPTGWPVVVVTGGKA